MEEYPIIKFYKQTTGGVSFVTVSLPSTAPAHTSGLFFAILPSLSYFLSWNAHLQQEHRIVSSSLHALYFSIYISAHK